MDELQARREGAAARKTIAQHIEDLTIFARNAKAKRVQIVESGVIAVYRSRRTADLLGCYINTEHYHYGAPVAVRTLGSKGREIEEWHVLITVKPHVIG